MSSEPWEYEVEIQRLLARVKSLEAALRPFAEGGRKWTQQDSSDVSLFVTTPNDQAIVMLGTGEPLTVGLLRAAYRALGEE